MDCVSLFFLALSTLPVQRTSTTYIYGVQDTTAYPNRACRERRARSVRGLNAQRALHQEIDSAREVGVFVFADQEELRGFEKVGKPLGVERVEPGPLGAVDRIEILT